MCNILLEIKKRSFFALVWTKINNFVVWIKMLTKKQ